MKEKIEEGSVILFPMCRPWTSPESRRLQLHPRVIMKVRYSTLNIMHKR